MEYTEYLKTISLDDLYSATAINAVVDMYKYSMCVQEIERRKVFEYTA